MSEDQRRAVQATLNNAMVGSIATRLAKAVADLTGKLKERGMQIVDADRKAFRDVMWPKASRPYMVKAWGAEAVKKLEALAEDATLHAWPRGASCFGRVRDVGVGSHGAREHREHLLPQGPQHVARARGELSLARSSG